MDAKIAVKGILGIIVLSLSTSVFAAIAGVESVGDQAAPDSGNMGNATKEADRKLEQDVHRALGKTKHLTSINIRVHAGAGAVTLTGTVPNRIALDRAAQVAQGVPGVSSVTNNLVIQNKGR